MQTVNCRFLWTGRGSCLSNVSVNIDDDGMIFSIEESSTPPAAFDFSFAMPSFVDAHVHYSWMVVKEASVDLSDIRSAEELLSVLRSEVDSDQEGIVRGESFDESEWDDGDLPSLSQLDSVTGNTPVFLRRVCGHSALANSAMLRLIDSDVPGVNRSSGVLKEWPVLNFEQMFPLPGNILANAVSRVDSKIFSRGVTAVCSFESIHTAEFLLNSFSALDVSVAVMVDDINGLSASDSPSGIVKIFLDGSFGAGNAALPDPYPDSSMGEMHYTNTELAALFVRCGEMGLSVAVHAIGGKALKQLDMASNSAFRTLGHGFIIRVEHAEDLMQAWPGTWNSDFHIFSMQPNFVERWQRPGGMYDRILSAERSLMLNPFRTVLDAGFQLAFGSDCMPLDPLYGLKGAVRHRNAAQSVSMVEALAAYTLDAASISGLLHLAAPLGAGRTADMVFLSGNPFESFDNISIEATMKNGSIVFGKNVFRRDLNV